MEVENEGGQPETVAGQGTGTEVTTPAAGAEKQPAGATSRPAQDTREYFDPKQHVPRSRLSEVSGKAQQREAALQAELDFERKRVQALSGVTPASKEEQEFESARKVLEKWYPGLAKLTDKKFIDELEQMREQSGQLQANTDHYWTNQGARAFRELEDFASKELGGNLSPRGQRALRAAFIDYIQTDEAAGQAYVDQDPNVVKGFWEDYRKSFIEPVRRTRNADLMERSSRLKLPRGGGNAPNMPAVKKPDFKNEDEVHDGAWAALRQRLGAE